MSAEPLSREEREQSMRWADGEPSSPVVFDVRRWQATVQAAEERAERAEGERDILARASVFLVAERSAAEERAEQLREVAGETIEDVRAIGQAWREDWSDFDGRTLRDQLIRAADHLLDGRTTRGPGKCDGALREVPWTRVERAHKVTQEALADDDAARGES